MRKTIALGMAGLLAALFVAPAAAAQMTQPSGEICTERVLVSPEVAEVTEDVLVDDDADPYTPEIIETVVVTPYQEAVYEDVVVPCEPSKPLPDAALNGQCPEGYTKLMETYSGGISWTADRDYLSVILVGGPDNANNKDADGRNKYFSDVQAGDVIARDAHEISHICAILAPTYVPVVVTPQAPTFTDLCGTEGDDYTVPADTETVRYEVVESQQGTVVTITAVLVDGRDAFAAGVPTEWSFTFTDEACDDGYVPVKVTPQAPTFTDLCGTEGDDYTVPANTETVRYEVVESEDGMTVTITAVLVDDRDAFAPYVPTEWSFTFTDEPCDQGYTPVIVVPETPSFSDVCGTEGDDYTVPANTETVRYEVVESEDGMTVTITAVLVDDRDAFAPYVPTEWSFTFTDEPCDDGYVPVVVTPAGPSFTDVCGTERDDYTVPADTETVRYEVVESDDGMTVTITAVLVDDRDLFAPYAQTEWTFTYTDEPCASGVTVVTPVRPTVTNETITCTPPYTLVVLPGTITVPTTPGVEYLLNGAVITGTLSVSAGTYAVTARPASADFQLYQPVPDLTVVVGAGVAPACAEGVVTVINPVTGAPTAPVVVPGATPVVAPAATPVVAPAAVPTRALAATGSGELPLQLMAVMFLLAIGAALTAGAARISAARAK